MSERLTFFRQSGWMMVATTGGGLFMWLVHIPAAARLSTPEYGVFQALLQVLTLMLIPAMGLQNVFAQQAAAAITPQRQQELAYTVRRLMLVVFGLWLAAGGLVFVGRHSLLATLQIANPAALWITFVIGLAMLWWPIFQGVMQGQQNFLWFGWMQILNGCTRFGGVVILVWALGADSAGAMAAALLGFCVALAVAAWQTRRVWVGPRSAVDWRAWLSRVVPLTLGLGASQFMLGVDQPLVQSVFNKNVTGMYGAAGMIGRALVIFTAPVMAVMFPKIVRSAARSEQTSVLAQAVGATALLGGGAALLCTFLPELPLRIIYPTRREYWAIAPLVPWFAWCMLPLTLANLLIGNLIARERFAAVPWLVLVAGAYGATLLGRAPSFQAAEQLEAFRMVVKTIGSFSSLLLLVAVWFTWRKPPAV